MLARGRWQATFTRDTTVLLPRSCTGFFLHASMPSKAKSNSAGKKPMGSGMKQTTLVARRSVVGDHIPGTPPPCRWVAAAASRDELLECMRARAPMTMIAGEGGYIGLYAV